MLIRKILVRVLIVIFPVVSYSEESSIESDIAVKGAYNDNIFLTNEPHDSVTSLTITPAVRGVIKEENWDAKLSAMLKSYSYSDSNLDSVDQLFDLSGNYQEERHVLSLSLRHDFLSNLNPLSSDFGLTGERVDRKQQSVTPGYTYLFSERTNLTFNYSYSDVDFENTENSNYTPYITESVLGAVNYDLTETDRLNISMQVVDYTSRDELVTYQLYSSRIGLSHAFSETLDVDFLIGVSRLNSTNLQTQQFDFFGNPVSTQVEIDYKNRGLLLDTGFVKRLETGQFGARLSRDDKTNSFGGVDQVDSLLFDYTDKITTYLRFATDFKFQKIENVSSSTASSTDRSILFFNTSLVYQIASRWNIDASYRYIQRRFKSDTSESRAPYSNSIYIGLKYKFPNISTY